MVSFRSGQAILVLTIALLVSHHARSEPRYGAGPVKIVVPFAPGGTTDVIARILAQGLSAELGQQFYIENRGGAGGILGADLVAKAPPDGQTMLVYHIGLVYGPGLYKQLPYDVEKDFTPVTLVGLAPSIHVVNRDLPVHTVSDFIALARAKPGELNYGSAGIGSSAHLGVELFQMTAGIKVTQIPFRGGGPAVMGVISGQVQFMIETAGGLMPHIQSGSVRTLGVTGEHRMPELPDVPTMREAGLKDYVYTTWYALWLPARTPTPIVARLNAAAAKVLAMPSSKAALAKAGVDSTSTSPDRMGEIVHSDLVKWTRIIREANITPQ